MKEFHVVRLGFLTGFLAISAPQGAFSQPSAEREITIASPITTGTVVSVTPDRQTITVRATQKSEPITFHGLGQALVVTGSGRQAAPANIQAGLPVTVFYTPRDKRWIVSKVVIPEPVQVQPAPLPSLTARDIEALQSPAANDDDITTQPNNKARVDNDVTTQAGKNALADPDITKRPN